MTAHERLLSLRRTLAVALSARAALVGVAVALVAFVVIRMLGLAWAPAVAVLTGAVAAALMLRSLRALQSLSRVALWVEERTPALRYSLVTIADGVQSPVLETQALSSPWWDDARNAALRSLVAPLLAAVLVGAVVFWSPLAVR